MKIKLNKTIFNKESKEEFNKENKDNILIQENTNRRRRKNNLKKDFILKKIFKINKKEILYNLFTVKKTYYLLLMFMIILASSSVYINVNLSNKLNEESYEVFGKLNEESNNNIDKEVNTEDKAGEDIKEIDTIKYQDQIVNNLDTRYEEKKEKVTYVAKVTSQKPNILSFTKPLSGNILKEFSNTNLIYSNTLELWKTHEGIDIKCDIGSYVKAIEKGSIEKVYEDSFFGNTIIVNHGQGYKSIYSNVKSTLKEKSSVSKGQTIGKVDNSSIGEIKDDPHMHFGIMHNNILIDPSSKIKF